MSAEPGRWILWPTRRFVPAAQLMTWACDDVDNGKHVGPIPKTLDDAVAILAATGSVTLSVRR